MEAWRREAINLRNAAAYKVACPECNAAVGEPCFGCRCGQSRYPCIPRQRLSPMTGETVAEIHARHGGK